MLEIIEQVYDEYLKQISKDNEKTRYEGRFNSVTGKKWFQISGAGSCIKKHYYKILDFEETPVDARTQRLFRLGDLVHTDIQHALVESKQFEDLITEYEVVAPELNIRGFLDIAFIDRHPVFIPDIKTVASYKWQKMFGRESNRDKNPSVMYELQVSSYAYALAKKLGLNVYDETQPALLYYKKDDSSLKLIEVSSHYIDKAIEYWKTVMQYINEVTGDNIEDIFIPGDLDVPVMNWECGYCNYQHICGGIEKK